MAEIGTFLIGDPADDASAGDVARLGADGIYRGATLTPADVGAAPVTDLDLLRLRVDTIENGGTIWRQGTPPPAGTFHRWTGTPHDSASEKVVDGTVVATNLIPNPRRSTSGWTQFHCDLSYDPARDMLRIAPGGTQDTNPYTARVLSDVPENVTVFMQAWAADDQPVDIRCYRLQASGAGSGIVDPGGVIRVTYTEGMNTNFMFSARDVAGRSAYFLPMVVPGEYLGDYFDGDTADDRAHDIWFHAGQDDAPYIWGDTAKDWIPWTAP